MQVKTWELWTRDGTMYGGYKNLESNSLLGRSGMTTGRINILRIFAIISLISVGYARADEEAKVKAGEVSIFEVSWMGMLAGLGTIEIQSPQKHNGIWHRVYHVDGTTGEWFKGVYVAKDQATAFTRPWDWGVSKFYIEQEEGKLVGSSFVQKKWLDFDHDHCKVHEKVSVPEKPDDLADHDLHYGAIDAIGGTLRLRSYDYVIGKSVRYMIYTSEKNWWLEATPTAVEDVTVPAGRFKTTKLKLQTYLGKQLQQKGEVNVWVANAPPRQIVQVQGEIKIGSVYMRLSKYQSGQ